MKKIPFILLVLLFNCSSENKKEQKKELKPEIKKFEYSSIDSQEILVDLFNGKIKDKQVLWSPSGEDVSGIADFVSSDGFCHTEIDTILKQNKNDYFIFFRTDIYEKKIRSDCHICVPLIAIAHFKKTDSKFVLKQFKKSVFQLGGWGEPGDYSIIELPSPLIKVTSGYTGTGAIQSYENYFDLENFDLTFGFVSFDSNGGMHDENTAGYEETKKIMKNIRDHTFDITTTNIVIDSSGKKQVRHKSEHINLKSEYGKGIVELSDSKN